MNPFYQLDPIEREDINHLRVMAHKRYVFDTICSPLPEQLAAIREWGVMTMGDDPERWDTDEWGLVAFRDQNDAIAFKMRWM